MSTAEFEPYHDPATGYDIAKLSVEDNEIVTHTPATILAWRGLSLCYGGVSIYNLLNGEQTAGAIGLGVSIGGLALAQKLNTQK